MIGGRGETWKIEFPAASLITAHEAPFCKCCHQRLPLAALKPTFLYSMGENTGYDPCRPEDVLVRWKAGELSPAYIDEPEYYLCHRPMAIMSAELIELLLWCFGYQLRDNMQYKVLAEAREFLKLAETTSVAPRWPGEADMTERYTEYRLVYARWALKTVKIKLREMKREGKIPTSATVR
jgi:hypothetical protein